MEVTPLRAGVIPLRAETCAIIVRVLTNIAVGYTRHCTNCSEASLLSTIQTRQGNGNHLETSKLPAGAARTGLDVYTHGLRAS